jgi:hypothetical protein
MSLCSECKPEMDQRKVNRKPHNCNRSNFAGGGRGAAANLNFQNKKSK